MVTAVDTNVLADLIFHDERFESQSMAWIEEAQGRGGAVVCHVVYAELVASLEDRARLDDRLRNLGLTLSPINTDIAYEAGLRWSMYRSAGGPRTRILPDFLIGAHALATASVFLTRDEGFSRPISGN